MPDLRGEFLRGTGTNGATEISGRNVGYHQDATKHLNMNFNTNNDINIATTISEVSTNVDISVDNVDALVTPATYLRWVTRGESGTTVDRYQYYNSRPTNTSVLFCIRW